MNEYGHSPQHFLEIGWLSPFAANKVTAEQGLPPISMNEHGHSPQHFPEIGWLSPSGANLPSGPL